MELAAGIDVGGTRKGSHIALVDSAYRLVEPVLRAPTPEAGIHHLIAAGVTHVAIDAPRRPAPDGARSRACERELRRITSHGIFWTPDSAHVATHYLRDWLEAGFAWFAAVEAAGLHAEEAFPSAAFAELEPRAHGVTRSAHTTRVVANIRRRVGCGSHQLRSQDDRDALCAAWIARACIDGRARSSGATVDEPDRITWIDATFLD
jgi:predicted nuclease with RNAse H fold